MPSYQTLAKGNPKKYYKRPEDVFRDRRLDADDRRDILYAWKMHAPDEPGLAEAIERVDAEEPRQHRRFGQRF